jgi:hypothetical protein
MMHSKGHMKRNTARLFCHRFFPTNGKNIKVLALVAFCAAWAWIAGCGGGGNSAPPVAAPSDLTYSKATLIITTGQAIATDSPSVTGTVTSYTISPALPAGLSLNASTGVISGTPTIAAAKKTYTITASNASGSTSVTIDITVAAAVVAPSGLTYSQSTITGTVGQAITPDTASVTGTISAYAISPALPAGLALNASTGTISGTPTAVSAQASYTIKASNSAGSVSATIQVTVEPAVVAPSQLAYPRTTITATVGQAIIPDIPSVTGTVTTYSVSPALPAGLALNSSNGIIAGAPTSVTAQAAYTVTASNPGGDAPAPVTISVISPTTSAIDLGHANSITAMREQSSTVLSQDSTGHWVLWDYASAKELASGDSDRPGAISYPITWPLDLAGPTVAIGLTNGVEVFSSTDGSLLAMIASPLIDSLSEQGLCWWQLASDGSYISAGSKDGLSVWSPTGQLLVSRQGDYSVAKAFSAPGQVLVAVGAAGLNVIETIAVADGSSSVGPAFSGNFNSWFLDGARFLTNDNNTVWTYSKTSAQQALVSLPTVANLTGQGNWIWTYDAVSLPPALPYYAIGASTSSASFSYNLESMPVASKTTIGLIQQETPTTNVVDLSGTTPTQVSYTTPAPTTYTSTYAAASASQWLVGNSRGLILDGPTSTTTPRYFGLGAAFSISGGTSQMAIATASGEILLFDTATISLQGKIDLLSGKVVSSSDGTVLAASTYTAYDQDSPPSVLTVYTLPAATVINTWSYPAGTTPALVDFSLSGSGDFIGQVLGGTTTVTRQVTAVTGGTVTWSDTNPGDIDSSPGAIQLSPDGSLVAVSIGPASVTSSTNIYKNGQLVTAVSGLVVGWVDNNQLLVNNYVSNSTGYSYSGASSYSAAGVKLASPALPEIDVMQPLTSNSIYSPKLNSIFSLNPGATTWSYPYTRTGVGAVAGDYVVFASGNRVLIDAH